ELRLQDYFFGNHGAQGVAALFPALAATSTAFPATSVGATALAAAGDTSAFAAADSKGVAAVVAHFAAGEAADGRFDPHRAFAGSSATSGALTGISSVAGLFARATATKEVKDVGFEPHRVLEPASSGTAMFEISLHSISAKPAYAHWSFEELRLRHSDAGTSSLHAFAPRRVFPRRQPPVGDLRFAAPKKITGHRGTVNATTFGANCMQSRTPYLVVPDGEPDLVISEDCLFINVWTPTAVSENPLPVMVWVYGGNFKYGGTSMGRFNGANLVDKAVNIGEPVIVVSMNYRVRKHISAFGGDSSKITAFGESAGANSIGVHLVSNKTGAADLPLFDAAILESAGVDFGPVGNGSTVYATVYKPLAAAVNCSSFDCMKSIDAEVLLEAQLSIDLTYRPYVDHSYIIEDTAVLLRTGQFDSVPILLGTNKNEGTVFSSNVSAAAFEGLIDSTFAGLPSSVINNILALYPLNSYANTPYGNSSAGYFALADVIGDFFLQCPVQMVADAYSTYSKALDPDDHAPIIYRYFFTYLPASIANSAYAYLGVYHSIEIPYVFADYSLLDATKVETDLVQTIVGAWTHFARTLSTPNGWAGQEGPVWPKYVKNASLAVGGGLQLVINGGDAADLTVETDNARTVKCVLWDQIQVAVSST
ncbi:hypothetical protein HK405_008326, partial [Cladochytrium tenue]